MIDRFLSTRGWIWNVFVLKFGRFKHLYTKEHILDLWLSIWKTIDCHSQLLLLFFSSGDIWFRALDCFIIYCSAWAQASESVPSFQNSTQVVKIKWKLNGSSVNYHAWILWKSFNVCLFWDCVSQTQFLCCNPSVQAMNCNEENMKEKIWFAIKWLFSISESFNV